MKSLSNDGSKPARPLTIAAAYYIAGSSRLNNCIKGIAPVSFAETVLRHIDEEGMSYFANASDPTVEELAVMYLVTFKTRLASKTHGDMLPVMGHIISCIRAKIVLCDNSWQQFILKVAFVRSTEKVGKKSTEVDLNASNTSTQYCVLPEPLNEFLNRIRFARLKVASCICGGEANPPPPIDDNSGWIELEDGNVGMLTSGDTYIYQQRVVLFVMLINLL